MMWQEKFAMETLSNSDENRGDYSALLARDHGGWPRSMICRLVIVASLFSILPLTWSLVRLQSGKIPSKSYPNLRVQFFDEHTGVIIGPRVFHTKDGGESWSIIDYVRASDSFKARDGPKHAKYLMQFVDPEWAWRISPFDAESVEYSKDGGRSWSEPIRTGVKSRSSIVFVTRGTGWVLGDIPVVTSDGGQTWRQETVLANLRLQYPYFLDPNHGWLANYWGVIARTTDGGQTWSIFRSPLKQVRSLFFITQERGWAVGDDGLVASTENGGVNWTVRESPAPYDTGRKARTELLDVFFLTADLGWIVGQNGLILITTDGGQNWNRVSTPTLAQLSSVRFTDALHGWAVGGDPTPVVPVTPPSNVVLETSDGGRTWRARLF
jgi:photosystem II stability/assembly factor-like uncharacterized protein